MYNTVVMTCGISLLTGNNYFSLQNRDETESIKPSDLQEREITPEIGEEIALFLEKAKKEIDEALKNPNAISAEYSMIHTLIKNRKLIEKKMKIILIATDTVGGRICIPLLSSIFRKRFDADVEELFTKISVSSHKEFKEQLGDFLCKLGEALSVGDPGSTCFAPIGGYKVMTSLGYIVGSFLHYPTSYLHEEHQILIEIPPMPLEIDDDFVQKNGELLRKCKQDYLALDDLDYREKQIVEKYDVIFAVEDGYVALNPFGIFLFERSKYEHLFKTKYVYSEQVASIMKQNNHQSIFIHQQMRELAKKLKEGVENDEVYHEKTFKTLDQNKLLFHLYKGASNGQTAFRLAYQYDWTKDELFANYLWLNHDKYEREAGKGVGLYKEEPVSTLEVL